jgi:O-antigen ligase
VSTLGTALIALGTLLVLVVGIARPTRTIIPLYAALVPIGGVFRIPIPLPPPFNTLSSLIGGIAIFATMMHVVLYRRTRIPSFPVAVWLIFLSWSAVTVFWAQLPAATVQELLIALPLVLLMVVVGILPSGREDVGAVRLAIVIGGAMIGAYALGLLINGSSLPIHGSAERFSIATDPSQTNPNQIAATLLLPLIFSLDLVIWGRGPRLRPRTWRFVGAGSSLLITVALILTGSRGGVIAAAIGFLLILFFTWRWYPHIRRAVLGLVAGALLTVVLVGLGSFVAAKLWPQGGWRDQSIAPLLRLTSVETGTSGRTEIWGTGYLACKQFCGLGAGLGNFPVVFTDLFATSGAGRNVGLGRPGHDLYLELAVETGFIGLTLLGFALAAEWMALRSADSLAPALGAALVALLVADGFESFIWFKYFWLLFIVIRLAEGASSSREGSPIVIAPAHDSRDMARSTGT